MRHWKNVTEKWAIEKKQIANWGLRETKSKTEKLQRMEIEIWETVYKRNWKLRNKKKLKIEKVRSKNWN